MNWQGPRISGGFVVFGDAQAVANPVPPVVQCAMRGSFLTVFLVVMLASSGAAFWGAYGYFKGGELQQAGARLSLYRSTVDAELERFSHLPFVLARDTFVIETATGGDPRRLNARLATFAERAGIDAIYLMDEQGITRSASNAGRPDSFVGQDYSFRPYFQAAIKGQQGQFYGVGVTTGVPGYFFANAVRDDAGEIRGVIAIKIDLSDLQRSWQEAGERVLLANADGVVLLASVQDWRYRSLSDLTVAQLSRIAEARQFGTQAITPLDWQPEGPDTAAIDGQTLLHLQTRELPNEWSLHYFASDAQAITRAWLVTGVVLFIAGTILISVQFQRARRIGAALRRSEREEAELRAANERLAVEIEERRSAERRLQRTQDELERAGRLAVLGQLAASVTHELGQPIAAMRNHLAAAEMQGQGGAMLPRLQGLVDRMEGITRQLKFFARKGKQEFEQVDLRDAIHAVLELMRPSVDAQEVTLDITLPDHPVMLQSNRLRIEQVMTNLMRNAVDAMVDCDPRVLSVALGQDDDAVWFTVGDTGHGLGDRDLRELAEPFVTTRESGQGMGLGLAISSAIVDDHGGRISAQNRDSGGAIFRVTFPKQEHA